MVTSWTLRRWRAAASGGVAAWNMTKTAATVTTPGVMTWVAVIFLPLAMIYQEWTCRVFRRRRIGVRNTRPGH